MVTPLRVLGSALAAALCLGALVALPARSTETITTQDYVDILNLNKLHTEGVNGTPITGKGITIAVIDGPMDTSVPELAHADITSVDLCPAETEGDEKTHATAVVSELVAAGWGIVPDAKILHYGVSSIQDPNNPLERLPKFRTEPCDYTTMAGYINRALSDGADIISISMGTTVTDAFAYALVRAYEMGVPVVFAVGNSSTDSPDHNGAYSNLSIGVSAVNGDGTFADYSNYGPSVTVAGLAEPFQIHDLETGDIRPFRGTSAAAPMVAGLLAAAMQAWPEATGNQIIQNLIATATSGPNQYFGYGIVSISGLIREDPTTREDVSPLLDKIEGGKPTAQQVADYADGLVDPGELEMDPDYIYRGTDQSMARGYPERTALGTSPRFHRDANTDSAESGSEG